MCVPYSDQSVPACICAFIFSLGKKLFRQYMCLLKIFTYMKNLTYILSSVKWKPAPFVMVAII